MIELMEYLSKITKNLLSRGIGILLAICFVGFFAFAFIKHNGLNFVIPLGGLFFLILLYFAHKK